jgi:hypothetical protein
MSQMGLCQHGQRLYFGSEPSMHLSEVIAKKRNSGFALKHMSWGEIWLQVIRQMTLSQVSVKRSRNWIFKVTDNHRKPETLQEIGQTLKETKGKERE